MSTDSLSHPLSKTTSSSSTADSSYEPSISSMSPLVKHKKRDSSSSLERLLHLKKLSEEEKLEKLLRKAEKKEEKAAKRAEEKRTEKEMPDLYVPGIASWASFTRV
ncbi:hypothetical protein BT69DRAFT_1338395 [Atractiella rhizophila]|nr:hypothetical protein BT69DRAFT_1338395 [Atractiella rhizophila]